MYKQYFNYMKWGILLTMIDFRVQGFDILPDIVGYILFAVALGTLKDVNRYFRTANVINIILLILSIFSIKETPSGMTMSSPLAPMGMGSVVPIVMYFGMLTYLITSVGYMLLNLFYIYNILSGCKEIARENGSMYLAEEADNKFKQFLAFSIASICAFVVLLVPVVAFCYILVMFIAGIAVTISLMSYMSKCETM